MLDILSVSGDFLTVFGYLFDQFKYIYKINKSIENIILKFEFKRREFIAFKALT